MKTRIWTFAILAVVVALVWGIYVAVRAHGNLVTLDVRDLEVRAVVKKIEWQTWERIFVHQNVQGKITLNVRKMPLDEVLNIIDEQISSRWSKIYPLYSTSKSLVALKQSLRGEIDPAANGWTNLQSRSLFRGGGFGLAVLGLFSRAGPKGTNFIRRRRQHPGRKNPRALSRRLDRRR